MPRASPGWSCGRGPAAHEPFRGAAGGRGDGPGPGDPQRLVECRHRLRRQRHRARPRLRVPARPGPEVSRDDFALVYLFITTGFFVGELVLAGFPTSLTRYLAAPGASDRGSWFLSGLVAGLPLLLLSLGAGVLFAARPTPSRGCSRS